MEISNASTPPDESLDHRIAGEIRRLRQARGWSLDELSAETGISRATLSRLEKAEVSATAATLGKLARAFGLTASRLLHQVEGEPQPLVRRQEQPVWVDPVSGFVRRAVSPPASAHAGEVIEGEIPADTRIAYDGPARPGLEHHLVMLEGALTMEVGGKRHDLVAGDCLRYVLNGPNLFRTPPMSGARYLIFLV